jgi:queuine/archaeosine tRNA-ribosyltransferase
MQSMRGAIADGSLTDFTTSFLSTYDSGLPDNKAAG